MSTLQLFGIAVAIWGTSWIATKAQIAAAAPKVAVALRFSLAALLLFGWCRWRGVRLDFSRRTYALFALLGGTGFCLSYILIYHAERYIVSGLVATFATYDALMPGSGRAAPRTSASVPRSSRCSSPPWSRATTGMPRHSSASRWRSPATCWRCNQRCGGP